MLPQQNQIKTTLFVVCAVIGVCLAIGFARWQFSRDAFSQPNSVADVLRESEVSSAMEPAVVISLKARQYYKAGEYLLAAENFATAAKLDSGESKYQNDAGHSYWKGGDYGNALVHLETATELAPNNLRYANNLATLYVDMHRERDALAILREAHQNDSHAHFNLGYLFLQRQRRKEAIAHLETALSIDPELERASLWLRRLKMVDEPDELRSVYLSSPRQADDGG